MDDLIAFVRARLDEDEQVARAAQPGPWTMRDNGMPWTDVDAANGTVTSSYEGEVVAVSDAMHIVRWDPARVLAEIEAKRRILDLHESHRGVCLQCSGEYLDEPMPCPTVRLLALPCASNPGYREEWKPAT